MVPGDRGNVINLSINQHNNNNLKTVASWILCGRQILSTSAMFFKFFIELIERVVPPPISEMIEAFSKITVGVSSGIVGVRGDLFLINSLFIAVCHFSRKPSH